MVFTNVFKNITRTNSYMLWHNSAFIYKKIFVSFVGHLVTKTVYFFELMFLLFAWFVAWIKTLFEAIAVCWFKVQYIYSGQDGKVSSLTDTQGNNSTGHVFHLYVMQKNCTVRYTHLAWYIGVLIDWKRTDFVYIGKKFNIQIIWRFFIMER